MLIKAKKEAQILHMAYLRLELFSRSHLEGLMYIDIFLWSEFASFIFGRKFYGYL